MAAWEKMRACTFVEAMDEAGAQGHGPRGGGRMSSHGPSVHMRAGGCSALHADTAGFVEYTQNIRRQEQHGVKPWNRHRVARLDIRSYHLRYRTWGKAMP
jgi:hypothetical protein